MTYSETLMRNHVNTVWQMREVSQDAVEQRNFIRYVERRAWFDIASRRNTGEIRAGIALMILIVAVLFS